MANVFIDYETKICAPWLNTVDTAVNDALGHPTTPTEARINIGAASQVEVDNANAVQDANIALKADITYVDNQNATQDDAIALKVDQTYVDNQNSAQDAVIASKADITYVDAENNAQDIIIDLKADITYVDAEIAALVAGGVPDGDKGDIVVSGSGTIWTLDSGVVTSAARTVIDDATVAAMVDTLGGAASTGTGGLVRATSPTLVTPALGTPASGDLSNCTNYPLFNNSGMQCRLALSPSDPEDLVDVTSSTIYLVGYIGTASELWNGSSWQLYDTHGVSLAIGTVIADRPYDVFLYLNGTTPTLESLAWTNATTRAVNLAWTSGRQHKAGDATRRFLGTVLPNTTTTIANTQQWRGVSNNFHLVPLYFYASFSVQQHTYTTVAYREWNNGVGVTRPNFVLCKQRPVNLAILVSMSGAFNARMSAAIDSTTSPNHIEIASPSTSGFLLQVSTGRLVATGSHYATAIELGQTGATFDLCGISGYCDF